MIIKNASDAEIDIVVQLLIDKAEWLEKKNMLTWNKNQISKDSLQKKYINPDYYISYEDYKISGAFILLEKDDRYWPEIKTRDALYLHKFMVCNDFNGKGYSKKLLDWIKDYGKRINKKYIRLDFNTNNLKVKDIYLKNGFKIVENIKSHNETGYDMSKAEFSI